MFEASDAGRLASSEDSKMWRLLLARLHPDAGGDHDLFVFASALREEMFSENRAARTTVSSNVRGAQRAAAPFLQTWQEAMDHWSTSNHDALKNF